MANQNDFHFLQESTVPVQLTGGGGDVLSFEHCSAPLYNLAKRTMRLQCPDLYPIQLCTHDVPAQLTPRVQALLEQLRSGLSKTFMTFQSHNLERGAHLAVNFYACGWDGADEFLGVKWVVGLDHRLEFWVNLSDTRVAALQDRLGLFSCLHFRFERIPPAEVQLKHVEQGIEGWMHDLQMRFDADLRTKAWSECLARCDDACASATRFRWSF